MKHMTLEDHKKHSQTLFKMLDAIEELRDDCCLHYGKSHRTSKSAQSLVDALDRFRSKLDDEYHRTITNEEFKKHGHIYYYRGLTRKALLEELEPGLNALFGQEYESQEKEHKEQFEKEKSNEA